MLGAKDMKGSQKGHHLHLNDACRLVENIDSNYIIKEYKMPSVTLTTQPSCYDKFSKATLFGDVFQKQRYRQHWDDDVGKGSSSKRGESEQRPGKEETQGPPHLHTQTMRGAWNEMTLAK